MHPGTIVGYPATILEKHLDSFGHVNNATYLELYEEARWELITKNNYGLNYILEKQIGPVILEVNLRFIKELVLRTNIIIKTQVISYKGKISELKQWMEGMDGTVYSEAVFKVGLFDMKTRKLISPTPEWLHAIGCESRG